jgi:hypothetical protein
MRFHLPSSQTAPSLSLQKMIGSFSPRLFTAWSFAVPAAYFVCGFLGNYYPAFISILLLTMLFQILAGAFLYRLLGKAEGLYASNRWGFLVALSLSLALMVFVVAIFLAAQRFPALFDMPYVLLEKGQTVPFIGAILLALPALVFTTGFLKQAGFQQTAIYHFVNENAAGLFVSGFFFAVYFIFSFIINQPAFNVDDIFFDSDGWLWRTRFATDAYQDYYWRSVHPFVLIIIRPIIAFTSLFLRYDRFATAFLLVASCGALCVFFAWYFVRQKTGNTVYAMLAASLLGGSAAHLIYGSLLETYIFLVVIAMAVVVLLLKDTPFYVFIAAGILSFGITLSSVIQPGIVFALQRRSLKQWIIFGAVILALSIPLTLLNNVVYPNSQPYFFDPSSYGTEGRNTFEPSIRRAAVVGRVMFAYSFVAPDPLVISRELEFLKIWMVDVNRKVYPHDPDHMRFSEYKTAFGTAVAVGWLLLAGLGVLGFLKNFKKEDNWFSISFILIILYSFFFHLIFGKELFLYATNWTYAITFFLALGWKEYSGRKWFQTTLLVFIILMLINNARLIFVILGASALVIH